MSRSLVGVLPVDMLPLRTVVENEIGICPGFARRRRLPRAYALAAEDAPAFYARSQVSLLTPLPFDCAGTVSEPHLFHPWNLRFERKQIPRFVVNVNS